MEKEQLEKKVEWLDSERRKALDTITALEKRLADIEKSQTKQTTSAKSFAAFKSRLDTLEESMTALEKQSETEQTEAKKGLAASDKQIAQLEKTLQQEQKGIGKVLEDFRKEIGQLQAIQKVATTHGEKILEVQGKIDSLDESIQNVITGEQKRNQLAETLEAASKEDAKRLTEMRAEVAALLTRLESAAKQSESVSLSQRKVEKRIDEVSAAEKTRKEAQDEFLAQAALAQTDREHQWKSWVLRFDAIEKQSTEVSDRLKDFDNTELALKRAQKAFDELVEKINRRVNELSEIQRLGDQRFRQEWSTFQADAQKRWSAFTLTHEEQQREAVRQREKLANQVASLEDALREAQDTVQHLADQSERNLQSLLELARDSLAEHERFLSGNSR